MKYPISKRALKVALLSSVMAAPIMASQSALAQDDDDDNSLEVIVVTATKRETNLMDTPIAISAFTEESLDRLGIKNVKDLNNLVPNMSIMVDVESSAPIITMRGVRSTNTTEIGDPAVGLHFDGIYSPRPQGALALMFDIERAEIMRGPQGTLFGRNSTVGSLNIISKKPDLEEFSGQVQAEYGRWNKRALKAYINFPISDTFAVRIAGMIEKQDSNLNGYWDGNQWDQRYLQEMGLEFTQVDSPAGLGGSVDDWEGNNYGGPFNDYLYAPIPVTDKSNFYNSINQYAFRMSALWKPSDNVSLFVTYEKFRDDSAGAINSRDCERIKDRPVSEYGGSCTDIWGDEDDHSAFVNIPGKNDVTMDSVRSQFIWDVTDSIQFVYNMGFQSQERTGQIDLDQGYYFWDDMLKWLDTDYDSWNHEFQVKSTGEGKLQWIAGYFDFHETNAMNGQYHGAMGGVASWQQPERYVRSNAFFAQATYELSEKLFLTLGGRNTNDTKGDKGGRNYGCWTAPCYANIGWNDTWGFIDWSLPDWSSPTPYLGQPENTGRVRANFNELPSDYYDVPFGDSDIGLWNTDTVNDVEESWSKFTWRVGLDYDLTDDTMIYGYVANGYKSGSIGDVLYLLSEPGTKYDTSYDPETVVTYEFGIKAKVLDGKMNLRANAFYSDYQGQQQTAWEIFDYLDIEEPIPGTDPIEFRPATQELGTFLTRNIGKSKISGIELEMEWAAWENGHIGGYLTFMDTELQSDYWKLWGAEAKQVFIGHDPNNAEHLILDESDPFPWFKNLKGNDLPFAPKVSFTLNVSHDFHLSNGATLTPFLNVHYESSSYMDLDNRDKWEHAAGTVHDVDLEVYSDKRKAWALANFNLNYRAADDVWFVEAYINNLTNANVNWWQTYKGTTPVAAKARQTYGLRAGINF